MDDNEDATSASLAALQRKSRERFIELLRDFFIRRVRRWPSRWVGSAGSVAFSILDIRGGLRYISKNNFLDEK